MKCSISDIARRAGVSTTTVSRVLNDKPFGVSGKTREHVKAVMYEMNYRPSQLARGIALSHSNLIGMIIPDVSNLFYPQILRGVDDYISQHGYSMLLYNSDSDPEREKKQLLTMVDHRVDGIMLCSGVSNEAFLRDFRAYGVPMVMIGRTFDSTYADGCITGDNESGMYQSTSYMLDNGHRRILYLDGAPEVSGPMNRFRGYRHALQDAGLEVSEALVHRGEFSIQYGFDTVKGLLEEGLSFTAIVSGSDLVAIGAIKALHEGGLRVPEDIEVIGFDNIDLSSIYEPQLSTVSKPHYEIATAAARILLSVIDGSPPPIAHIATPAKLILRSTTRPQTTNQKEKEGEAREQNGSPHANGKA